MDSTQNIGGTSGIYTVGGITALSHHGVQGQKWGVRRYQNPDGSRTAEGRKHYGYKNVSISDTARRIGQKIGSKARSIAEGHRMKKQYGKETAKLMKKENGGKRLSEMSDAEIEQKIKRLRLENQLLSEIKQKNQTAIDLHNSKYKKETLYSKYGQDLVKTVIDKYANSQVRAAKVKADIDYAKGIEAARITAQTNREKNRLDNQTARDAERVRSRTAIEQERIKAQSALDVARENNRNLPSPHIVKNRQSREDLAENKR